MKIEQFLLHHGIAQSPFSEEDAQTDAVFKTTCIDSVHHPAWQKVLGSPSDPSTALVFGEKGSGKTALRLQVVSEIERHNQANPTQRVFVVTYDDFNPFLDHFRAAVRGRDADEALQRFRLEDHMDAILALGVTKLVDDLTAGKTDLSKLPQEQKRDLLLLAALYDQSTGEPLAQRWERLRRGTRFRSLASRGDLALGFLATAAAIAAAVLWPEARTSPWTWALAGGVALGWATWAWRTFRVAALARSVRKSLRVLKRDPSALRGELKWFRGIDLGGQPLPQSTSQGEERFELMRKLRTLLASFGYVGIVVVVDRVDEPQMIKGEPRRMRSFVWPLLDHKFLRSEGVGLKLLLPIELSYYLEKEDKEFYDRARPDKLNLIKPLRWTGSSLYDLAGDRLRACAAAGKSPRLRELVDGAVSDDALRDSLGNLRTPRHLFKFLYRLIEEHCHRHTDEAPRWSIDADTFRSVYEAYSRDLSAFDRGYGHG